MRKVLVLGIVATLIAGCGGDGESDSESATPDEPGFVPPSQSEINEAARLQLDVYAEALGVDAPTAQCVFEKLSEESEKFIALESSPPKPAELQELLGSHAPEISRAVAAACAKNDEEELRIASAVRSTLLAGAAD